MNSDNKILRKFKILHDPVTGMHFVEVPPDVLESFNVTAEDSLDWLIVKDSGNGKPGAYVFRKSE